MKLFSLIIGAMVVLPSVAVLGATNGDAVKGKELYESRCVACHSVDENRVGPAHHGVYGRKAGLAVGYEYSDAVRKAKIVWSEKTLDKWLTNPEKLIPGQKMGYSVAEARDRQDLIAYLKSISDKSP
jgi:cytochrome c